MIKPIAIAAGMFLLFGAAALGAKLAVAHYLAELGLRSLGA